MNKGDLVKAFADISGITPRESTTEIETLMNVIKTTLLTGEEVTLPGVGKLKVSSRAERNGRNPATGAPIVIPAKRVVKFSPSSDFKESIA